MSACSASPTPSGPGPCCCASAPGPSVSDARGGGPWIVGRVDTPVGQALRAATDLTWRDHLGAVKVRLNLGRMSYTVEPGLYAVGKPTPESHVLVSANYKLSFDRLRCELGGRDVWILVLDTKGINVWCAAGKGTFGTDEIVRRIEAVHLGQVVTHRALIVPQLGAPGVAAHEVKKRSGFRVIYGPVRARDIPAFLDAGLRATPEMRRVRFDLWDRLAVVPVELAQWSGYALLLAASLFLLAGLGRDGFDSTRALGKGVQAVLLVLVATVGGGVFAPVFLPWLPGRAFSVKGAAVGFFLVFCVAAAGGGRPIGGGWLEAAAWFLLVPALASFLAMNFTGASTYTSLSGVKREMRRAVPAQLVGGIAGLALWVAARFVP